MRQEPGQGRGLPAGGKTWPASPLEREAKGGGARPTKWLTSPSGVRGNRGGCKAYGVAENPGGNHQGVVGGVEFPEEIDTPGVHELPWGDKPP